MDKHPITDDRKITVALLIRARLPWLILGLVGGVVASVLISRYENILSSNIQLAFFIPIIVYMSDAIGTQTETIFVRQIAHSKVNFAKYLLKELMVGVFIGIILAAVIFLVTYVWLWSFDIALTVALAMFVNISIAPVIAVLIPYGLFREHKDPALGAGPITTVIQDIVSLLIYFLIATLIIFH